MRKIIINKGNENLKKMKGKIQGEKTSFFYRTQEC